MRGAGSCVEEEHSWCWLHRFVFCKLFENKELWGSVNKSGQHSEECFSTRSNEEGDDDPQAARRWTRLAGSGKDTGSWEQDRPHNQQNKGEGSPPLGLSLPWLVEAVQHSAHMGRKVWSCWSCARHCRLGIALQTMMGNGGAAGFQSLLCSQLSACSHCLALVDSHGKAEAHVKSLAACPRVTRHV